MNKDTKAIVLSKYYGYYWFYFECKPRKLKYLHRLAQKYRPFNKKKMLEKKMTKIK